MVLGHLFAKLFPYQVAVFKRWHCVTQRPLATITVLSAAVVVGKVGVGSDTMVVGVVGNGRCQAVDQLSARDLANKHGARCVINPIEAKARFPALSPRHRTLTYGDVVIERIYFYGSVHTHCVVIRQHAAQIDVSIFVACCVALPSASVQW